MRMPARCLAGAVVLSVTVFTVFASSGAPRIEPSTAAVGCCSSEAQPMGAAYNMSEFGSPARCVGSPSCSACKTCSNCAHCKAGGTCGVCARPSPTPTRPPSPASPSPPAAAPVIAASASPSAAAVDDGIAVYFSPNGHCTDAIVECIAKAKRSIRVLAYRLTGLTIDAALVDARNRGLNVSIVLDGAQQSDRYSDATFFANQGIPVLIDSAHAIAHNKIMLIDDSVIITGSFNFTQAAETSNAENLLIVQNKPMLAKAYLEEFERHFGHSKLYVRPADKQDSPK